MISIRVIKYILKVKNKMGQGNYYAVIYGIVVKDYTEELLDELLDDSLAEPIKGEGSYEVSTSYESDKNYIGFIIVINDKWLSNWWGTGYIENILNYKDEINQHKKFIKKAKEHWDKIQGILHKHGIKDKPEIMAIKDWD